ncbi:MAG: DUF4926 domain-containing protein [Anaerolineae bacterium]|nr:DUF4926 domain-containing protein [Anaerolineae bacterium]
MIEELETVVLMVDLPKYRLKIGDIGTVVLVHEQGYEVEFVELNGNPIAVISLFSSQIRRPEAGEIATARKLA